MRGWRCLLYLSIGVSGLLACAEHSVVPYQANVLGRLSAVATSSPGFSLEAGASLGWRTDIVWLHGEPSTEPSDAVDQQQVKAAIEQQLQALGYRFISADEPVDYVLIAVVVLAENAKDEASAALARLYPSLQHLSSTLEKGTLMVALGRPGSPVILWRAGVQAFDGEGLTLEQRQLRLQAVVRSLLRTIPREGGEA